MKKFFMFCAAAAVSAGMVNAQDTNYLQFFPNTEGSQLVSQTFDANGTLQATTTMTILENYEYVDGQTLEIAYMATNAAGDVIGKGTIDAQYLDDTFYLNMKNIALSPTIGQYVSLATDLSGDFLDYPDTFSSLDWPGLNDTFKMEGGDFTIKNSSNPKEATRINIYNRDYDKNEKITTPAGTFDASKITFSVDVVTDGTRETFHGVEWYSVGAGIVRSEIYDKNHNLKDYTVLTTLDVRK